MRDASPDRQRQVEALIYEALKTPPDQRTEFLDTRCAGDSELRKEVEALLQSSDHPTKLEARPPSTGIPRVMSPGKLLSRYKIISMLGAGGMGEVYLAEDTQLRRRVALKMIVPSLIRDERGLRRFEQEARAASALNHPNILTVYEFGQTDGVHYIASEFVEGLTLRNKMAVAKLDLSAAIDIAIQIASALAAAHESGIVHRDVKPENVIVRTDGIVKVLDFGIAKLSGTFVDDTLQHSAATVTSSISEPGMVVGTAKYMSPEQARGLDVDARSDIFSLGSVLYELVTGTQAFPGATSSDVIAEILKSEPAPPLEFAPDLPYEVERIISKALRKERGNRYQSVRDLLIDLQDFKKESEFHAKLQGVARSEGAKTGSGSGWRTPSSQTSGISLRQPRTVPRGKLFLGLAAVVAAATIGLIGYLHERKPPTPPAAARVRSLAVLPFQNLKQDAAVDFLGFSLADEIITKLGYVNSLAIRPSSSVAKYRDQSV
ncbi:MAG: serine/threonine-protein kinase, partial [Terriglobales bacterium]